MNTQQLLTDLKTIQSDLETSYKMTDLLERVEASIRVRTAVQMLIITLEGARAGVHPQATAHHLQGNESIFEINIHLKELVRNYQAMLNASLSPCIGDIDVRDWVNDVRALSVRADELLKEVE